MVSLSAYCPPSPTADVIPDDITSLLNEYDGKFKPIASVEKDGIVFHLSKPCLLAGKYSVAINYSVDGNGKRMQHLLYKSKSDGGWRSPPFSTQRFFLKNFSNLDKAGGEHYTQETKTIGEISDKLTDLESGEIANCGVSDDELASFYQKTNGNKTYDKFINYYQEANEYLHRFQIYRPGNGSKQELTKYEKDNNIRDLDASPLRKLNILQYFKEIVTEEMIGEDRRR